VNRNTASIERFLMEQRVQGLRPNTLKNYLWGLPKLAKELGDKAFEEATKEDLIRFFAGVQDQLAPGSVHKLKILVKRFYAWLFECEPRTYPSMVRWIRGGNPRSTKAKGVLGEIRPEDLLTEEEILKLVDVTDHPRDQAAIMLLYETACEAKELLNMRVKSVVTDKARTKVTLSMGDSARSLMIRDSVPYIQAWLNIHPRRRDPEAPLWVTRQQGFPAMGYDNLRRILLEAGKRAGIAKELSPRWLRHAGLTRMAKVLRNEQLLKKFAGWGPASRMAAIYIHLSGRDLDEDLARLHGEAPVEKPATLEGPLNPRACPRCRAMNAATHLFCAGCGQRLELGPDETKELERDLWLNTLFEVTMELREKRPELWPQVSKFEDNLFSMVEERIKAKKKASINEAGRSRAGRLSE